MKTTAIKFTHFLKSSSIFFLCSLFFLNCTSVENERPVSSDDVVAGRSAALVVKRKKNSWVSILANVNVYINELPVGHVKNGKEETFLFIPSKDGTTSIRFESSDIDMAGFGEAISKDTTLTSRLRKEFSIKVKPKETVKFYCAIDSKELFVRRITE